MATDSWHLQQAKEIEEKLKHVAAWFPRPLECVDGWAQYPGGAGEARALLDLPECTAALWRQRAGDQFPAHSHVAREVLFVISGTLEIMFGPSIPELEAMTEPWERIWASHAMIVEPNRCHKARFSEPTVYVAMTVPGTEEWPRASGGQTHAASE